MTLTAISIPQAQNRIVQSSVKVSFLEVFRQLREFRFAFEQEQKLKELDHAVEIGDLDRLQRVLPFIEQRQGHSEINAALVSTVIAFDNPAIVSLLLNHEADIEYIARYSDDTTPLMFACAAGHLETVKLLIDRGANRMARDGYYNNVLHYAAEAGQSHVAEFLIAIAPQLLQESNSTEDEEWLYPDQVAEQRGHRQLAAYLRNLSDERAQCRSCLFFSDSPFLPCAVHPYFKPDCSDYKTQTLTTSI